MPKLQDRKEIGVVALAYLAVKQKIKNLVVDEKGYRVDLEAHLVENNTEIAKGHLVTIVEHAGHKVELKHELRNSSSEKADALNIAKRIFSKDVLDRVTETITILRSDVIEMLHADGTITDEQLIELYEHKKVYAFKVKKL